MHHRLVEQVAKTIAQHQLIGASGTIYIALSGGADSVALLRAMIALGYAERLVALHMNFRLRGAESDADEAFVRTLCQQYAVPLEVAHRGTRGYAKERGISIEMAARELRYAWFESLRTAAPSPEEVRVAVGHHADDQLETFFLNLSMGTGIRGLRGMLHERKEAGIIRPLLDCSRELILDYLHQLGQPWQEDSTNADTAYKRNLIRHRLLPLLEELSPAIRTTMLRTMGHLRATEALYLQYVGEWRDRLLQDGRLTFAELVTHPEGKTLLYELLRPYGFSPEVTDNVYRSLLSGTPGARFVSPTHILHRGSLQLELLPRSTDVPSELTIAIDEDGACDLPDGSKLSWRIYPTSALQTKRLPPQEACFDCDALSVSTLSLRGRRSGDALHPYGMRGKKLLRRIFIDGKYSQQERRDALLLCRGDIPIWLIGRLADRKYGISETTQRVLHLTLTPSSPTQR